MKYLITLIFILPVFAFSVQAQSPATGEEALRMHIQHALENNPGVKADASDVESARLESTRFGRLGNPMVELEYDVWSRDSMDRFSMMVMQSLPWFGTLSTNRRYYDQLADVRSSVLQQSQNDLIREVRLSWYMMHETYHHIFTLQANLGLLDSIEKQFLTRLETGRATQVDLIRIGIEQDEIINRISGLENRLRYQKTQFNALLNRDKDTEIELYHLLDAPQAPEDGQVTSNPQFMQIDKMRDVAQTDEERARLEGLPNFNVGLGMMSMGPGFYDPNRIDAVMVRVDIGLPVYRSQYRARRQQANIQRRQTDEIRQEMHNRLSADLQENRMKLDTALRDINMYRYQLIPAVRRALDLSMESLAGGRSAFEEIIQLQRQLLDLEMKLNEAETQRNTVITELDYLTGNLIENDF